MTPEEVHWHSSILKLKENADSVIDEHLDIQNKTPDSSFFITYFKQPVKKKDDLKGSERERKKRASREVR